MGGGRGELKIGELSTGRRISDFKMAGGVSHLVKFHSFDLSAFSAFSARNPFFFIRSWRPACSPRVIRGMPWLALVGECGNNGIYWIYGILWSRLAGVNSSPAGLFGQRDFF